MTPATDKSAAEPAESQAMQVAGKALARKRQTEENPEPSLGSRLGKIGVLGWMIVLPALLGVYAGHWLDKQLHSKVMFAAALLMLGAGLGMYWAWKWMHKEIQGKS